MDPFIVVEPGQRLYPKLRIEDVPRVIESAIGDFIDEELIYKDSHDRKNYNSQIDIPFFKMQTRTILGTNQKIDPIRILDYVEQGGYAALEKYPGPKFHMLTRDRQIPVLRDENRF